MNLLALSGSARQASTNTALLRVLADVGHQMTPMRVDINLFDGLRDLPIFSPDIEGAKTPDSVLRFADIAARADGIILSSPEYVHAIPGGLKNAIDWLVSRDEIIGKPIVLLHASHRGDDMLAALRLVLETVSDGFDRDLFLRFPLISMTPTEVDNYMKTTDKIAKLQDFLLHFIASIRAARTQNNRPRRRV